MGDWLSATRRCRAAALLVCALASSASAQSVELLSGEHAAFSRLAAVLPKIDSIDVSQTAEGYRVRLSPRTSFDLGGVFRLIPRTRILDVRQDPQTGDLVIFSDCRCEIDVFQPSPRVMAIDVKDAGIAPAVASEAAGTTGPPPLPPTLLIDSYTEQLGAAPVPPLAAPRPRDFARAPYATIAPFPALLPAAGSREAAQGDVAPGERTPVERDGSPGASTRADIEDRVAGLDAALRRAAEAGLVELAPTPQAPASEGNAQVDPAPLHGGNVDFRSAFVTTSLSVESNADRAKACPPPDLFDFMHARSRAPVGDLRAALVTPRGDVSPDGARALAEAYLALSFGAEARQVIPEIDASERLLQIYDSLAHIVDQTQESAPEVWAGLETCRNATALWALLGQELAAPVPELASNAIQEAFFQLPAHLRLHLGDEVATRLARAGASQAAAAVANNLDTLRSPIPASPNGADPGSTADPIVQPGAVFLRTEGLLKRLESEMAAGAPLDPGAVETAAALVDEFAETDTGARLEGAIAVGALQRGRIDETFAYLSQIGGVEGTSMAEPMLSTLTTAILGLDDGPLVRVAFHTDGPALMARLSDPAAIAIADRLLSLGFPERALLVVQDRSMTYDDTLSLIEARASLATGDARRALALLAGRSDPPAARVRGDAHARLGNHALAAQVYFEAGAREDAAHMAWLSADEDIIRRYGTETQREIMAGLPFAGTQGPLSVDAAGLSVPAAPRSGPDPGADGGATPPTGTLPAGRAGGERIGSDTGRDGTAAEAVPSGEPSAAPVSAETQPDARGETAITLARARELLDAAERLRRSVGELGSLQPPGS